MNHDWQTGCDRVMSSAPFRLFAWLFFGMAASCVYWVLHGNIRQLLYVIALALHSMIRFCIVVKLHSKIAWFWCFIVLGDIGLALYTRYWVNEESNVGYAAHFAGALIGEHFIVHMHFISCRLTFCLMLKERER